MTLNVPNGTLDLELSPSSTVPGSPQDFIDLSSEVTPTVVEVNSSESEVEEVPIQLTPELEIQKMKEEERYGYLYRVEDRQRAVEKRVRGIVEDIASQDPQARKARRQSLQLAIVGDM